MVIMNVKMERSAIAESGLFPATADSTILTPYGQVTMWFFYGYIPDPLR